MTKFERWFIKRVLRKEFIQGPRHHLNAAGMYALIREVWQDQFTEDNQPTTDVMLREAFEASQWKPHFSPGMVAEEVNALRLEMEVNALRYELTKTS